MRREVEHVLTKMGMIFFTYIKNIGSQIPTVFIVMHKRQKTFISLCFLYYISCYFNRFAFGCGT